MQWSLGSALKRVGGDEHTFRQVAGLLWYQRALLHSDIVVRRRGVYQVGPHCIRAGDLLGFFEIEKKSQETTNIIVYPRLVDLKSITLPMRELFGVPGANNPVWDPVYTLGTRDYQPSGPSRHIHWKASHRHWPSRMRRWFLQQPLKSSGFPHFSCNIGVYISCRTVKEDVRNL